VPRYDYDCKSCGRRFEVTHGVHADPPARCPLCGGGPVKKAIAAPTIHFKGSGWAKKERRAATAPSKQGGDGESDDSTGDKAAARAATGGASGPAESATTTASTESKPPAGSRGGAKRPDPKPES
jgi:putative FmdB family regulatory protein